MHLIMERMTRKIKKSCRYLTPVYYLVLINPRSRNKRAGASHVYFSSTYFLNVCNAPCYSTPFSISRSFSNKIVFAIFQRRKKIIYPSKTIMPQKTVGNEHFFMLRSKNSVIYLWPTSDVLVSDFVSRICINNWWV